MNHMNQRNELVAAAIRAAGGPTSVGKALGISPRAVSKWRYNRIPATRVVELERLTGGRYKRHELRPDVFPSAVDSGVDLEEDPVVRRQGQETSLANRGSA